MTFKQFCTLVAICVGLFVLTSCAHPVVQRLAPDSSKGGNEFQNLAIAALIVLVLIPVLVKPK